MSRPNYQSFEAADLDMSPYSADEADALLPIVTKKATAINFRSDRKRIISVVAIVLAIVGVTLLVSFSSGSSTKYTAVRGTKANDMHSFESISTGPVPPVHNTTELAVEAKKDSRQRGFPMKSSRPSRSPISKRPSEIPTSKRPTRSPDFVRTRRPSASPTEQHIKTDQPTDAPTPRPSNEPPKPTHQPSPEPTSDPTSEPSRAVPSRAPESERPTFTPRPVEERRHSKHLTDRKGQSNPVGRTSESPVTRRQSKCPDTRRPSPSPVTRRPSRSPFTKRPTRSPDFVRSRRPSASPTEQHIKTDQPTDAPTPRPSDLPTFRPSNEPPKPTHQPSPEPTSDPTSEPSRAVPSRAPESERPTFTPRPVEERHVKKVKKTSKVHA